MCWFFIVIKLLILKILLAGLMVHTTALRYDYGYHPSAEEFDNLLHETRRTWTHNFLKSERDRELLKQQQLRTEARYFVPKFNYETEQKKFQQFIPNSQKNPYHKPQDLQFSSSNKNPLTMQNIGSSLEFTYEIPKPFYNNNNEIQPQFIRQPTTTYAPKQDLKPVTSSALPEINLKPIAKPDILTNQQKYSVNNLYKNNSQAQFPIYFTNPATGIVYAITEVGKSAQNLTRTNGSIPIFITKEQYERDIFLLKNEYDQNCHKANKNKPLTSFSRPVKTTTSTTSNPQIIRIQKPSSTSKFTPPNTLKKPAPVVVKTELIVKDKKPVGRPIRKKKKITKSKKKLKKSKPPGRKPLGTTIRPILDQQPQGPKIIIGSRLTTSKPYTNTEKLSTQLEKPNYETTIFSSGPPIQNTDSNMAALNPNLYFNNRRINKRSVNDKITKKLGKITNYKTKNLIKSFSNLKTKKVLKNLNDLTSTENFFRNMNYSNKEDLLQNLNKSKMGNLLQKFQNLIVKDIFKNSDKSNIENSVKMFNNSTNLYSKTLLKKSNKSTEENLLKNSNNLNKENLVKHSNKSNTNNSIKNNSNHSNTRNWFQNFINLITKSLLQNSNIENEIKNLNESKTENLQNLVTNNTVLKENLLIPATKTDQSLKSSHNSNTKKSFLKSENLNGETNSIMPINTVLKENLLIPELKIDQSLKSSQNSNTKSSLTFSKKSKTENLLKFNKNLQNLLRNENFNGETNAIMSNLDQSLKSLHNSNTENSLNTFNKSKTKNLVKFNKNLRNLVTNKNVDGETNFINFNNSNTTNILKNPIMPDSNNLQYQNRVKNQTNNLKKFSKNPDFFKKVSENSVDVESEHFIKIAKAQSPVNHTTNNLQNFLKNLILYVRASQNSLYFESENFLKPKTSIILKKNTNSATNFIKTKTDNVRNSPFSSSFKSSNKNNSVEENLNKNPLNSINSEINLPKSTLLKKSLNSTTKSIQTETDLVQNTPLILSFESANINYSLEENLKKNQLMPTTSKFLKKSTNSATNLTKTKTDHFLNSPLNLNFKPTNKNYSFKESFKKNPLNSKNQNSYLSKNTIREHLSKSETTSSINFNNLNYKNLPSLPEISLKSKTDRIHKRSVENITVPKFKKKTNFTRENVLQTSNNSNSENLLKNSSSITNENFINSSINRSFKSATNSTKNLKSRNSNNKFLTPTNVSQSQRNKLSNGTTFNSPEKLVVKSHKSSSRNRTKISRKKKRLNKKQFPVTTLQLNLQIPNNTHTNSSEINITTPRTIKQGLKKLAYKIAFNKGKKSSKAQDTEYDFFDFVGDDDEDESEEYDDENEKESYEDDDDDDDEDDPPNDYKNDEYEEPPPQAYTSEAGLSVEDLKEKITHENSSSAEEDADFGALEEDPYKNPSLDYDELKNEIKTKTTDSKKRIRRRPAQLKSEEDYEDDDDENSISSNLGGFFRMIFYPVQVVMGSVMDTFLSKDSQKEEPINPYTQYTSYHNTLKQHSSDEDYYDDDDYDSNDSSGSSLSSWLSSFFGFNRRNKKIGSTTVAPVAPPPPKPTKSPTWLQSWFGVGANDRISTDTASNEDYDEYDKWFASWFGETKPKARKRTTTTTSTTTQIPQVPILTIVDPMRNPQNWIGILAHHLINHTSSSTPNPLKDMWAKATSTTTENPEIPQKITYDKYQIWRLKPQDDTQVRALEEYKKSEDGIKLQWLKGPSLRGLTDVLVPPKMLVDFQASLTFELIDHEVLIFDVGKAIAYEKTKEDYFFTTTQNPKKHKGKHQIAPSMTWHKYYEYDDIIKYLETMRMRFPHLVELIHIGRSYEGRPLIVMKIESKEAAAVNAVNYPAHQKTKLRHKKRIGLANAVFIEAGTHGMEWIGPATATWIINELLRIMKKNSTDDQSFIRNTTWYIMPVLNPDGYVYSHEYDRFWKKSRSRHVSRPSGIINSAMTWLQKKRSKEKVCFGVDLDRNWHYQWGRRGSSKSPCNEFFSGPVPFSEPETKALSEFLMDYRAQIKLFVSMQAYGQIISYPYKANTTYDTERLDDLLDVAMVGTDGLRKKGSKARYKIDSSNDLVENRSGCSDAFAAYEVGIPFSYTLQLADNGVHGYLLPSASIESTAKDSFEIITTMLDYI